MGVMPANSETLTMAALKLQLDNLDGIDDAVKGLYVADGEKFKLDVDGIEDTTGLKTALQKERKTAAELSKEKKLWQALGKSPEEIAALLEAQQEREQTEAERKGEWEKLRAQMNEKHGVELKAKDETIGTMRKRLEAELVDAKAVAAIAAAEGNPKLLLKVIKDFVTVDENFNVVVVDGKGDPRVNAKGEPLSIADLITELKTDTDYGQAFKGSGQSGSGMRPNNGAGGTGSRITKADLNKPGAEGRKARAAFVDANGLDAYNALPEK